MNKLRSSSVKELFKIKNDVKQRKQKSQETIKKRRNITGFYTKVNPKITSENRLWCYVLQTTT